MTAAVVVGCCACTPIDQPIVDAIAPAAASPGANVTIRGSQFCTGTFTTDGACESLPPGAVDFSLRPPIARAQIVTWRNDAITVIVPSQLPVGSTSVYVTVDGRTSNAIDFEVLP
jgi:uncharacterized protein (TIGR03437 family)